MAPQELKIYILHDLCRENMVSVFLMSKTAYLMISKKKLNELEIEEKMLLKEITI